ncbi:hypothetical protein HYH02_013888 [Chlamydomonas schloesseri]|uniref:Uncharacterized protein n=1 Tax=Chlamydomonas schloesseri TaxID=2026947 RepID=A0A835SMJ2_9CHLO|nr:hypothetical protein HYH02_013888 [Chlamydomonas schloesseri]|eukprot:KAG2429937.1 hypothetical protein HYH02_013888 [Chlamydomonas schloesseri]
MACVARAAPCGPARRRSSIDWLAKSRSCAQQNRARLKSESETTSDSDTTAVAEDSHGGQGPGPTSAQQPGGWLKLNGEHDTDPGETCSLDSGSPTSGTVSNRAEAAPAPSSAPPATLATSNGSTLVVSTSAAAAPAVTALRPAAAEQRYPSPVWSDLLGSRLHNYVGELREKAAARDSDGSAEFTAALLQHQLLRLQRRASPHHHHHQLLHGGSATTSSTTVISTAREMDGLNRRLRIHGAAAAAAAAAAVSRAARSGGAAAAAAAAAAGGGAGGGAAGLGLGLIKAAPRGGQPPGYRLVRDALVEGAREELLEGLRRVSAAQLAEGLLATAPPSPPPAGAGAAAGGAVLALNTIYTGTMDVKGNARACLPGRAAVMVGVLGLLALEPAWVLPTLPPPRLPPWRTSPASSSSSSSVATPASVGNGSSSIFGSSSSSTSTSATSIALLGGGGRGQHLSAAVALADALVRHRGLPPLPYHELRMLVVLIALLQEHPDLVDPLSGAPGCPAWGLASALELLVPLAGVLATAPVCGMAGSGDAVAHARAAGPVVRMHLEAARKALAAATELQQSMARKLGGGEGAATSLGGGGSTVTARGCSSRSSAGASVNGCSGSMANIRGAASNGACFAEHGADPREAAAAPTSSCSSSCSSSSSCAASSATGTATAAACGVDVRLFVRQYVQRMKLQAEAAAQSDLEQAPLCLWVAGRLNTALAPFLELGGGGGGAAGKGLGAAAARSGAGAADAESSTMGQDSSSKAAATAATAVAQVGPARSGAGAGGAGPGPGPGPVLRLMGGGGMRRGRLLRYELLRTVLATGLDGAPRSVHAAGGESLKSLLMAAAVVGYLRGASAWEVEQILTAQAAQQANGNGSNSSSSSSSSSSTGSSCGSSSSSSGGSSFTPDAKAAAAGVGPVRGVDEGPLGLRLSCSSAMLPAGSTSSSSTTSCRGGSDSSAAPTSASASASSPGELVAASLVPCGAAHLQHCRALREGPPTIEVMAASGVVDAPRDPHAQRRLRERVLAALAERRAVRLQCLSGPTVELAMTVLAQVATELRQGGGGQGVQDVVVVPELDPPDDQLPAAVAELMAALVEPVGGGGGAAGGGASGTSWRQQALAAGAVSAEAGAEVEPDAWSQPLPGLGSAASIAVADSTADGVVASAARTGAGTAGAAGGGGCAGGCGLRDGWRVLRRAGINRAACALLGVAGVGSSNEAEEAEALDGRLLLDFYPGLLTAMRRAAGGSGAAAGFGMGPDLEAGGGGGLGPEADGLEEELLNAAGREYERTSARPRLCDVPERVWVTLCVMVCAPGRAGAPGRPLPLQEPPPPGNPAPAAGGSGVRRQQAAPASGTGSGPAAAGIGAEGGTPAAAGAVAAAAAARAAGRRVGVQGAASITAHGAGPLLATNAGASLARRPVAL